MLNMTRWNPFEELNGLHRQMDQVFGRYLGDERPDTRNAAWVPATEIHSSDDGWRLRVALPGIDPQDVHVDLQGDTLTISGVRTRSEENGQGHLSEFHYGRFERTFTLPAKVDADRVAAHYDRGVLELSLPVAEASKPRRIAVGAGSSDGVPRAA